MLRVGLGEGKFDVRKLLFLQEKKKRNKKQKTKNKSKRERKDPREQKNRKRRENLHRIFHDLRQKNKCLSDASIGNQGKNKRLP